MIKFFVIVAEIVILTMSLRSSFAQYLLEDVQRGATDLITEFSNKMDQTQLNGLRDSMSLHLINMREFQQDYLNDVTSSKAKVSLFYTHYCVNKDVNPYVNGANLLQVCRSIESAKLDARKSQESS